MKTINYFFAVALAITLGACTYESDIPGPQGPQGPIGPEGAQGESGFVFEYDLVNFVAPDYEVFLPYPDDFTGLSSDVALVYLLWEVQNIDGQDVEVWRQVPQTVFTGNGTLQYNFDFSTSDVRLFLKANYSLDLLTAIDTDDWVVRVVVVPGEFWNARKAAIDFGNYDEVKNTFGLPELIPNQAIQRR